MALRNSSLIQNQNHGINFNGASIGGNIDPAKVQKKGGGLGGRKPLGDLSNAQKPSLDQTFKKEGPKSLADDVNRKSSTINVSEKVQKSTTRKALTDQKPSLDQTFKNEGPRSLADDVNQKSSTIKVSAKVQKSTTRKALTDISNSEKPRGSETVKKNSKRKVLAEEPYHVDSISEEAFLHNHQECIKLPAVQNDIDYFMETLGLHKDLSKKSRAAPPSSRLKMEDLSRSMQHEEMAELQLAAVRSPQKQEHFKEFDSPYPRSPALPYHSMLWKEGDISFTLAETPKILKL